MNCLFGDRNGRKRNSLSLYIGVSIMNVVRSELPSFLSSRIVLQDQTVIHYRYWRPQIKTDQAVIFLHRGHEHSGRLIEPIEKLGLDDRWVFAWDARGHGLSSGQFDSFDVLIHDLQQFVSAISTTYEIDRRKIVFVAHSFSAVLLTEWIREYQPDLQALVLLAPAFRINLFLPFAYEAMGALNQVFPKLKVRSFVRGSLLTRDRKSAEDYDRDKTITRSISVKALLELKRRAILSTRAATRITVPSLLLLSGNDPIVDRKYQLLFFDLLSSKKKMLRIFPGMRHDIFHELQRYDAFSLIRSFIRELERQQELPDKSDEAA